MSQRIYIICNPLSGNGQGQKKLIEVTNILSSYRVESLIFRTEYHNHAEVLSQQLCKQLNHDANSYLMVIGGDGTLHEVVSGLLHIEERVPITYIPAGTGNDFANTWLKGQSIRDIVNNMLFGRQVHFIPIFRYQEKFTQETGPIVNNMGFGFDAQVNYQVSKQQKKNLLDILGIGKLNYLISVFKELPKLSHFEISGRIDDIPFQMSKVTFMTIVNSPSFGGGIIVDNLADPWNEEIVLMVFHNITFWNAWPLARKILITKNQHTSPNIKRFTGQHLEVNIHTPVIGHVDGQVISAIPGQLEISLSKYPFYL